MVCLSSRAGLCWSVPTRMWRPCLAGGEELGKGCLGGELDGLCHREAVTPRGPLPPEEAEAPGPSTAPSFLGLAPDLDTNYSSNLLWSHNV